MILRPIKEILKRYKLELKNFDPAIAPRRYHKIVESLETRGNLGFLGAIAIYGLRRTGKTLTTIKIGEEALRKDYNVFYADLDTPNIEPIEIIKEAHRIAEEYREKLLVILDEAFVTDVRVLNKFLEAFKGLYDEKARNRRYDFGVIILGSYGIDIERLRAYILRTLSPKGFPPIIASLPRLCKRVSDRFSVSVLEALKEPPESGLRSLVIRELSNKGILEEGRVGGEALRMYEEYKETLGMPEILVGSKSIEEVLAAFRSLLEVSIVRFRSLIKSSKIESEKYKKITYHNILYLLKTLLGYRRPKKYNEEEVKLIEFVLNLGLLIPRWYIKEIEDPNLLLEEIIYSPLADLLLEYGLQPTPAHLFGGKFLSKITKIPKGIEYESIVAHCLIKDASTRYTGATLPRFPILSIRGIDFLYLYKDDLGELETILIEVKAGREIGRILEEEKYEYGLRKELDRALETAYELNKPLVLVTPETDRFYIAKKRLIGLIDGKKVSIYVIPIEALVAITCFE